MTPKKMPCPLCNGWAPNKGSNSKLGCSNSEQRNVTMYFWHALSLDIGRIFSSTELGSANPFGTLAGPKLALRLLVEGLAEGLAEGTFARVCLR